MKPKAKPTTNAVPLIATMRLGLAVNLDHELVQLAGIMPWETLAEDFRPLYSADNGRPGVPIRSGPGYPQRYTNCFRSCHWGQPWGSNL